MKAIQSLYKKIPISLLFTALAIPSMINCSGSKSNKGDLGGKDPVVDQPGNPDEPSENSSAMFLTWPQNATTYDTLAGNSISALLEFGDTIFVGTESGISISSDAGKTWKSRTTSNGLGHLNVDHLIKRGSEIYAISESGVSVSYDKGNSWKFRKNSNLIGHDIRGVAISGDTLFLANSKGLLASKDNGDSWQLALVDSATYDLSILSLASCGSNIYAGTASHGLYISNNQGAVWNRVKAAAGLTPAAITSIYCSDREIYVGRTGGVSVSEDLGTSWSNFGTESGLPGGSVIALTVIDSVIYAGTEASGVFLSKNGGSRWIKRTTKDGLGSDKVTSILFSNQKLFAGTSEGLSTSDDMALTWSNQTHPKRPSPGNSFVSGSKIVSAFDNRLWTSIDAGFSWKTQELPGSFARFVNFAANAILVGSGWPRTEKNKIYSSFDGGNNWNVSNEFSGSIVELTSSGSTVLALLELENDSYPHKWYNYEIRASTDSGKTWTSKGTPPIRTSSRISSWKLGSAGSKLYLFGLEDRYNDSIRRDEKRAIINISDDMGATWVKMDISSKDADLLDCSLVQENAIYVSISTYGSGEKSELLKSEDGGKTWAALPMPKSDRCNALFVSGHTIYVATTSGLAVSSDNGATWVNKTTADGLPSNSVLELFDLDSKLFVVTASGYAFGPKL